MTLIQDERAPYVQVADTLRAEIAAGEHLPGAKLPSVKKLAERFGIADMTVQSGLRVLREEGLIVSSPGRGTFVRSDVDPSAVGAAASQGGDDMSAQVQLLTSQVQGLTARVEELERRVTASSVPD
ncbi:winged helix-turn-helix domain-containing protein [Kitasatospora sp. NPDC001309]|uniref:winged helix-turn-helix domain-containing protein n=1 Tax=Kitasatospora sp. NPDC001309 TaxID=3364013 RepID=UPI00367FA258